MLPVMALGLGINDASANGWHAAQVLLIVGLVGLGAWEHLRYRKRRRAGLLAQGQAYLGGTTQLPAIGMSGEDASGVAGASRESKAAGRGARESRRGQEAGRESRMGRGGVPAEVPASTYL